MANEKIHVWDIFVRLFHWALVASFVIAYLTSEEENLWHIYSGYTVLGLVVFRVVWGIIGSRYARFNDFVYSPEHVAQYLSGLIGKNPRRYLGHNPAAGWMIIAMLVGLSVVVVSGLKVYAIEEGRGPFAGLIEFSAVSNVYADRDDDEHEEGKHNHHGTQGINEEAEDFWEDIHEGSVNFLLVLISLHIAGVLVSSRLHNENLVKAMITGKK